MTDRNNIEYWKAQLDEQWIETMGMIHKGKDVNQAINEAFGYLICDDIRLSHTTGNDFKRLVNGWLSNKRFPSERPNKNFKL